MCGGRDHMENSGAGCWAGIILGGFWGEVELLVGVELGGPGGLWNVGPLGWWVEKGCGM